MQPHTFTGKKRVPDGDPIPDYFPRVIDADTFYAVQELYRDSKKVVGRVDRARNLFVHLVKCAYCSGPMALIEHGKYMVCDAARRKIGCRRATIRYDDIEKTILDHCHLIRPELVLPNPNEQGKQVKELRITIDGQAGLLADIEQQIENLVDQIASTKVATARNRYEKRLVQLEEQQADTIRKKAASEQELAKLEQSSQSYDQWQAGIEELKKGLKKVDNRIKMRAHLRQFLERIEVFPSGYPEEKDAAQLSEMIDAAYSDTGRKLTADDCAFMNWLTQQRQTKGGKFLRLWFRTGPHADLVPEGSLASGLNWQPLSATVLKPASMTLTDPDIVQAWQAWQKDKKKRRRKRKTVK